jgi:two-component system, LytTR family, response regulator AlgR
VIAPLRILIADDEAIARSRLARLCDTLDGVEVIGMALNGRDALSRIADDAPDLVLLDIAMPDMDGLAVAKALDPLENAPAIVFVTAFDAHALAAYEVSAVDYLLKPVSSQRLARAVEKVRRLRASDAPASARQAWLDCLWVPHRGAMVRIDVTRLERIDAERDYVRLWTADGSFLLNETISNIESKLDPALFARIRRSTIVRRAEIVSLRHGGMGSWTAQLQDGSTVRIGPTYLKKVKALLAGR